MLNVALTGNIAAGKSSVCELFRRWGATIIDADQLTREVEAPGSPVLGAIVARFGPGVVRSDGTLDRAGLRAIVLADPGARRDLEAMVHPAVEARRAALVEAARRRGDRIVISDIPLLFEAGKPEGFDAVVLVDAPVELRLARLMRDRGWDETEARRMLAAQGSAEAKRGWRGGPALAAPFIIENAGDRAELEAQAARVWAALLVRAPA
ncbi:MAG TPA: dephospho-CoA kinase [Gemmatimonadales bacterium]|nr:dephospho-CoA kinase [Gemmatimonadales bacterium]